MAEKFTVVSLHVEKGGNPTRIQGCIHNPPTVYYINGKDSLKTVSILGASLYC